MSENIKRLCTLLLAISMIFSMLPVGAVAQTTAEPEKETPELVSPEITEPDASTQEEPKPIKPEVWEGVVPEVTLQSGGERPTLELGVPMDATISEQDGSVTFAFVPEQTGVYNFYALSDVDTRATLRDADGVEMTSDDNSGENGNFLISATLTAGNCYTLAVDIFNGNTGSFQVVVERSALVSISFTAVSAMEYTKGWWNSDENGQEYYYYYPQYLLSLSTYTATFIDGTELTGSGDGLMYNDQWFGFNSRSTQDGNNPWTAGNDYSFFVDFMGQTAEVPVTITASPLESISFTPVTVTEYTLGQWENVDSDEAYYRYYTDELLCRSIFTANFSDGTELTGSDIGFAYNEEWFGFNAFTTQGYDNPWTAGNTYYVDVDVLGQKAQLQVTVEKSPLESITFTPLTVPEYTNGGWETDEYGQMYYNYHSGDLLCQSTYTATFTDGTVITGNDYGFTYNNEWYGFNTNTTQSYENQWTAGNTYNIDVDIMGKQVQAQVSIEASPLESISFAPITVTEYTNGQWGTDEYGQEYYYYNPYDILYLSTFTANFSDGTQLTGSDTGFTYNDEWYDFNVTTDQSYENRWTAGNTYYIDVDIMGKQAQAQVTIVATPLESISFTPITVTEYTNGEWDIGEDGQEYYHYNISGLLYLSTFTANFSDGTQLTGSDTGFTYNDEWYGFEISTEQGYYNQWTVGNTYELNLDILGQRVQVPVTIVASPLESISFTPITVTANTNGQLDTDEYGREYYYYFIGDVLRLSTFTANFSDGTVITDNDCGFAYNETWYDFSYDADQSYENQWTAGNTYYIDVDIMGQKVQVPVTIAATPLESITFTPVTVVENTCGYLDSGEGAGYYYYWIDTLLRRSTFTATFTDGTVISDNNTGFTYNETWYDFSYDADQSSENQWTAGNTYYINVKVLGKTVQVPVSVIKLPLVSLELSPITISANTCGDFRTDEGGTYFHYDRTQLVSMSTYTATFADGTVLTGNNDGFEYNGSWISFEIQDLQSSAAPWMAGETYTMSVGMRGVTAQLSVTIEASPLESLEFTPVTVVEGTRGHWESYWVDGEQKEYYHYDLYSVLEMSRYTATFTDGYVTNGTGNNNLYYQGQSHPMHHNALQDDAHQWKAGETYIIEVTAFGKTVQVPVTIVSSPVASITAEPIVIVENRNGTTNSTWVDSSWVEYYEYFWWNKLNYTVTFTDGTVETWYGGNDPSYQGQSYSNEYYNDQCYENQWTAGNTYTAKAIVMGYELQVEVTIAEPPIQSVVFDPIILEPNKNGYWSGDYFRYSWNDNIFYTVTFKDGTVKQGSRWNGVSYDGERYGIESVTDNQGAETPWLPGNTYKEQIRFAGKWYDVYVSVCENTEDNGFTYFLQDGKAIIDSCTTQTELIQIPETIDGYPVVGIISLGEALNYALEIRIPDSVTVLSQNFLMTQSEYDYSEYGSVLPLQKLTLGSGISAFSMAMLRSAHNLESIEVAANNPYFRSIDGVLYNKDVTVLIAYPLAKTTLHTMPDTVTNADVLFEIENVRNICVQFGAGIEDYRMVDGVVYNRDMTEVLKVTGEATGSYVMPESVTDVAELAFANSNLTSVTLSPSVTYIAYYAFAGAEKLEEINIPGQLECIDEGAFIGCSSLKKVNISDLNAWCEAWFFDNPLRYAHDLYLNGQLVKNLVIPETVAEGVYTRNYINFDAFVGGSFETVSIPARIDAIGADAFYGCENLKKVYITDLGAWSGTLFGSATANPLYYAHDLYLNGQLVKDLVLTETVADRVYGHYDEVPVLGVNNYAFCNASIETVTVPKTIQTIGYSAFEGCEKLTGVNISDLCQWGNIEFENSRANPLYYAEKLYLNGQKITNLELPRSVTYSVYVESYVYGVNDYAFYNIDIDSLKVPDYVSHIGKDAFHSSSVEEITFEEGISSMSAGAFYNCAIRSLDLPNSLRFLYGRDTFASCTELKEVNLGSGLRLIPENCFRDSGLTSITLPKQLECVSYNAFMNSKLEEVIVNCDNLSIYDSAFAGCPLGDLDLGDNVQYIDWSAFEGINATQIKHPASVTEITYRAYASNMNLVSVTIPDSVEHIYSDAFDGDRNLSHVLYTGTQEQWDVLDPNSFELQNATIHFEANGDEVTTRQTCATIDFYCAICDKWETVHKETADHVFDGNMNCTICEFQGYWKYEIDETAHTVTVTRYVGPDTAATVPSTIAGMPVTAFTADTFAYNRKLSSVTLPDSITVIPEGAFSNCSSLHTVKMGSKVTTLGAEAFFRCTNLKNVQMSESVTEIGNSAFHGCIALRQLSIPDTVTEIGYSAFLYCGCLEEITIPSGVTEISDSAFEGCWSLQELEIPDTVTTIGYYAFMRTGINQLVIPTSVKEIGELAFVESAIQTVIFQGDMPAMCGVLGEETTAFYAASNKTWNNLPDDGGKWLACKNPTITKQPAAQTVQPGKTVTLFAGATGQRLSYQWYYAEPDSFRFTPIGGNTPELTIVVDKDTTRGRAYCVVTDLMGQTAKTETVTLRNPSVSTGIRIGRLPYTVEYDLRQQLRTRGLQVLLTYSDGTEEEISGYQVSGYNANVSGDQTVTVTYSNYTATFTVHVNEEKVNFVSQTEEIEISAPEGAVDNSTQLVVEKLTAEEPPQEMPELPEVIQDNTAVIFDITLEQEGEAVQPTQAVQVSIPVPENMESKRCKVYHITDDGTAEDMNARYVDGRMVFDTEHFSYYAVVEVGGVTISGTVSGLKNMAGAVVNLISGGETLETAFVSTNGTYRFENVVNNSYVIEAVQEGVPAKRQNITVADQNLVLDILLKLVGDVDNNEEINSEDVIRLLLHVTMPNVFQISEEADFNGDGLVTSDDVICLLLYVTLPNLFPLTTA